MSDGTKRLVVIGGDAAGLSAASAARRLHKDWEIVVYEKGPYISYASCGVPYYVADWVKDERSMITITRDEFEEKRNIKVKMHHEVIKVDTKEKTVAVKSLIDGNESMDNWDNLVIATGAVVRVLPVPGVDLPNVFVVKNLEDGVEIKKFIVENKPKSVAIIGGSYVGLEMAEGFKEAGISNITIMKRSPRFLGAFAEKVSDLVVKELQDKGVRIVTQVKITAIEEAASGQLEVVHEPASETPVVADLVILATGVRPCTDFLKGSGIQLDALGAVDVDRHMKTNVPGVWAAGDCANVYNVLTGEKVYYPLATVANKQGRYAGYNIGGRETEFPGTMETVITKVFDLSVSHTGLSLEQAKELGYDAAEAGITHRDKAHYFPGSEEFYMSVVVDAKNHVLLGASIAGTPIAAKKIDTFVAFIASKMDVNEIQMLDLSYAPPFSPVYDAILIMGSVASKKLK